MPKIIDHDQYRNELLEQCFHLMADRGYGNITMRQIGQALKISTGKLYHYFPSKQKLFASIIEFISYKDIFNFSMETENFLDMSSKIKALHSYLEKRESNLQKYIFLILDYYQLNKTDEGRVLLMQAAEQYSIQLGKLLGFSGPEYGQLLFSFVNGMILQRIINPDYFSMKKQFMLLEKLLCALGNN